MSTHYEQLNDREIIELQRVNILHVTWRLDKCERFTLSLSLPLSHLPLTSAGSTSRRQDHSHRTYVCTYTTAPQSLTDKPLSSVKTIKPDYKSDRILPPSILPSFPTPQPQAKPLLLTSPFLLLPPLPPLPTQLTLHPFSMLC
ncbi:hypothetical protein C0Q70_14152 [Pomacea canaliculata]|uniref:Uncharacterized protein n=1 Tax=Pomacea canaliculata TaxID=400727 RepID=A0A2T7NZ75_POMCA|nr:hypothetical protein C0Q70_14152 [Pomacea canaliculata]